MIVVDASAVVDLILGGQSPAGDELASRFAAHEVVVAPHLLDAEVAQVLRRYTLAGALDARDTTELVEELILLPIRRYPHGALLARAFELRRNVTVYDALYLALAETVEAPLLTGDVGLSGVPGCSADVEVRETIG